MERILICYVIFVNLSPDPIIILLYVFFYGFVRVFFLQLSQNVKFLTLLFFESILNLQRHLWIRYSKEIY